MKFADKVIGFLQSYPETEVEVKILVHYINPSAKGALRESIRRQVRRILDQLVLMGRVHQKLDRTMRGCCNGRSTYIWVAEGGAYGMVVRR